MKVSGVGFNLTASAPFVIGNVPFRDAYGQTQQMPPQYLHDDPPPPYTEKPVPAKVEPNDDDFEFI